MEILVDAGIPTGPVQTVGDALSNEQTEARGMVTHIDDDNREIPVVEHSLNFGSADAGFEGVPPDLGKHTFEVFEELGDDRDRLERLRDEGVFGDD
jgi:crotonobetainyl-CoA:carnitine CoA-transferase CaiB-like acyl-CoA transferase